MEENRKEQTPQIESRLHRHILSEYSAPVEHPGMRTKSWTGKVKNGKKIYGRRKRKGNQTI